VETKIYHRFQQWKILVSAGSTFNKDIFRRTKIKINYFLSDKFFDPFLMNPWFNSQSKVSWKLE